MLIIIIQNNFLSLYELLCLPYLPSWTQLKAPHTNLNYISFPTYHNITQPNLTQLITTHSNLNYLSFPSLTQPTLTQRNLTTPHLTSPYLTSSHLTSPHLTSPHLTLPHLTSPHLSSPNLNILFFLSANLESMTLPEETLRIGQIQYTLVIVLE